MNVNFTPTALTDLKFIHSHISEQNAALADRVVSRIRQITQVFERFPLIGREGKLEQSREFSIPGLPYIIVYQIKSETEIDALTIVHERQEWPLR